MIIIYNVSLLVCLDSSNWSDFFFFSRAQLVWIPVSFAPWQRYFIRPYKIIVVSLVPRKKKKKNFMPQPNGTAPTSLEFPSSTHRTIFFPPFRNSNFLKEAPAQLWACLSPGSLTRCFSNQSQYAPPLACCVFGMPFLNCAIAAPYLPQTSLSFRRVFGGDKQQLGVVSVSVSVVFG